ncbi:MAG: DegV family protein [Sciscionella sp.]
MTGHVAIVTDSTASLPAELAEQWDIAVVQLQVIIGNQPDDEARVPMSVLLPALQAQSEVSTSPPETGAFFWTYQAAAAAGASAVVSMHISGRQSETLRRAQEAAAEVRIPVHVLDSQTTGTSLGYAALAAARVAQAGAGPQHVLETATAKMKRSKTLFYVDTLEYLRRGGRIGTAAAWIGTKLSIKPLLTVTEGQVAPLVRERGKERALRKLVKLATDYAGTAPVDIAVEHFAAPRDAQELLAELKTSIPEIREIIFTEVSATVGVHVGPGALGLSISTS